MARINATAILTVFLSTILAFTVSAQVKKSRKKPPAVLVLLKAERNRENALIKAKKYNELEMFRQDVNGAATAMIMDFRDHFSNCPVYYFSDTNFDAVLDRKFAGVLLNSDLSPATNIVIADTNTDYLIVYYGDPTWQTQRNKWDTTKQAGMAGKPNGKGLIVNDYQLRQITYLYRLDFDFFNFKTKGRKNPYKYSSKKFDIEYFPFAAELNRKIPAGKAN